MPAELRVSIENKITDLKTVKDAAEPDIEKIKTATSTLSDELSKIGEILNKAAQAEGAKSAGGPEPTGEGQGPVRDADFEEKK